MLRVLPPSQPPTIKTHNQRVLPLSLSLSLPQSSLTSVSWPMTPSHLAPMRPRIWATLRMVSLDVQTSTRAPAPVSRASQRSPGRGLVTRTRWVPASLWIWEEEVEG